MRRRNPVLGLFELRRAEAGRLYPPPPKRLSCVPAAAFRVSFRSQSKGLERRLVPGGVFKRMQGIPRSRIAVSVRRRFRCAAVECVCPPAVPRRSGNGVPAPVCVSPRRSSRSGCAPPMRSSAFAPPIFCERCAAAPNAAGFLRLAQAAGGMAFTGRFSDAERSLSAPV